MTGITLPMPENTRISFWKEGKVLANKNGMKSNNIMCFVILLESLVITSISTKSWEITSEKLLGRMKTMLINQRMIG